MWTSLWNAWPRSTAKTGAGLRPVLSLISHHWYIYLWFNLFHKDVLVLLYVVSVLFPLSSRLTIKEQITIVYYLRTFCILVSKPCSLCQVKYIVYNITFSDVELVTFFQYFSITRCPNIYKFILYIHTAQWLMSYSLHVLFVRVLLVRWSRYNPYYLEPEVRKEAYSRPETELSDEEREERELKVLRPIKAAAGSITSSVYNDPAVRFTQILPFPNIFVVKHQDGIVKNASSSL